jgi:hypothetical protein
MSKSPFGTQVAVKGDLHYHLGERKYKLIGQVPLPDQTYNESTGMWTQSIRIEGEQRREVQDATIEVRLLQPTIRSSYVVRPFNPRNAVMVQELFGPEGSENSACFRIGLRELQRDCYILITLEARERIEIDKILLSPY